MGVVRQEVEVVRREVGVVRWEWHTCSSIHVGVFIHNHQLVPGRWDGMKGGWHMSRCGLQREVTQCQDGDWDGGIL